MNRITVKADRVVLQKIIRLLKYLQSK